MDSQERPKLDPAGLARSSLLKESLGPGAPTRRSAPPPRRPIGDVQRELTPRHHTPTRERLGEPYELVSAPNESKAGGLPVGPFRNLKEDSFWLKKSWS